MVVSRQQNPPHSNLRTFLNSIHQFYETVLERLLVLDFVRLPQAVRRRCRLLSSDVLRLGPGLFFWLVNPLRRRGELRFWKSVVEIERQNVVAVRGHIEFRVRLARS